MQTYRLTRDIPVEEGFDVLVAGAVTYVRQREIDAEPHGPQFSIAHETVGHGLRGRA